MGYQGNKGNLPKENERQNEESQNPMYKEDGMRDNKPDEQSTTTNADTVKTAGSRDAETDTEGNP